MPEENMNVKKMASGIIIGIIIFFLVLVFVIVWVGGHFLAKVW